MNEFQKRVEEFRSHYLVKYGQQLDDEILYFFIRVNEMQHDFKRQLLDLKREVVKQNELAQESRGNFIIKFWKPSAIILLIILQVSMLVFLFQINNRLNLYINQTSQSVLPSPK
jgi:hypothetical protein